MGLGLGLGGVGLYWVATTVYGAMAYRSETAQIASQEARERVSEVADAVEDYRSEVGACPTIGEDLVGHGLLEQSPRDPWGRNLVFVCSETRIVVVSSGPDGAPGTDDDVRETR